MVRRIIGRWWVSGISVGGVWMDGSERIESE